MTRQVEIRDKKTNQILREDYLPVQPTIFGIPVGEAIKIGSFIVAATVFFINGEIRQKAVESNQKVMTETLGRLVDFTEASDSWHSAAFGTQFKGGRPIDGGYHLNRGNVNP